MTKDNYHRLLKRQIKEHLGEMNELPPAFIQFINAVNTAYKDYDQDLEHAEHILKESSQELFKKNKELNLLLSENEKIIQEKTKHLFTTTRNLQYAEKIAGIGNFSWNLSTNEIALSTHFNTMLGIPSHKTTVTKEELSELFIYSNAMQSAVEEGIANQTKVSVDYLKLKNSPEKTFLLEGEVTLAEGETKVFAGILQDITDLRKREISLREALQELENYKKAIDHAGIISKSDRLGNITYVNDYFTEISGYSKDELIGSNHNVVNSGYHEKQFFGEMWKTISSGAIWKGVFRNRKKDGSFYWVDSTIVPFYKDGKLNEYISIRFDITDKMRIHRQVEEQKVFYETILNSIPVDIAVFNSDHKYLFVNPFAIKDPEKRAFIIGKDDFEYCRRYGRSEETAVLRQNMFNLIKNSNEQYEFTDKHIKEDGSLVYNLRRFFPILDENNELIYMIGFGINITERVEQSKKIEQSLQEKEALLGEIHHRVKNNLALVLGLIEMQIAKSKNESLRQELSEVQHRISAMSLIHEKLYKTANFAKVDLSDYLQDLVKFLSGFYNKDKNVKLNFDLEGIFASTKKAIPVALIVNELITNCYKYAFKEQTTGIINISLKRVDEQCVLTIADNGPGLPSDLDLIKIQSLGFKLLNIFTKQLKGSYEAISNNGLSITIKFKNEQEGFNR